MFASFLENAPLKMNSVSLLSVRDGRFSPNLYLHGYIWPFLMYNSFFNSDLCFGSRWHGSKHQVLPWFPKNESCTVRIRARVAELDGCMCRGPRFRQAN